MYKVYLNPAEKRILVTRRTIREGGWLILSRHATWEKAYRRAVYIADKLDFILEWFLEEEIN